MRFGQKLRTGAGNGRNAAEGLGAVVTKQYHPGRL